MFQDAYAGLVVDTGAAETRVTAAAAGGCAAARGSPAAAASASTLAAAAAAAAAAARGADGMAGGVGAAGVWDDVGCEVSGRLDEVHPRRLRAAASAAAPVTHGEAAAVSSSAARAVRAWPYK